MCKSMLLVIVTLICAVSEGVVFSSLPEHLLPCYRGGGPALGAPRRLDVFLSLLKKLEVSHALDMKLFSTSLLRSFRLDGIEEAANAVETEFVTPYRASGFQFNKYKLLMDLFLPTQNLLDSEIMSLEEKCLLHVMLSGAVQHWERGDEDRVCPLASEQMQNMALNETSQNLLNSEIMSLEEKSLLHLHVILSGAVQHWERGDEDRVCPLASEQMQNMALSGTRVISRCPIEIGVIKTDWGSIAAGTIVAAVAAALEPQRVAVADILNADVYKADVAEPLMASAKEEWYSDIETLNAGDEKQVDVADISNLYAATLAGDLAEVVVNQGPRVGPASQHMVIGSNNRWNDTMLPRNYFMYPQNSSLADWHITDAEILAGIDGLILASYLPTWISQRNSLRLSQVLDMYYSDEGVSFEPRVKACNRQSLFKAIVDSTTIATETSRFAHVLYLTQGGVYIPVEKMNRISDAAVSAFTEYLTTLFSQNHRECKGPSSIPQMNLVIATDAAWKQYDVEQFVSWIGGALEMDLERSTLGLLHGNTGRWIAPPSHNLTAVFSHISNFTDDWPNRMNIPNVISTIIQHARNQSIVEESSSAAISTVVLIINPSDRPSANDVERARELMHSLRTSFFDIYFGYASMDLVPFQNINNEYMDYSEIFLQTESTTVPDVVSAVELYLSENDVATRIVGAQCPFNDTVFDLLPYEDFVLTQGVKRSYRIHPFFLREQSLISVQFRNQGHGEILVCTWRGAEASRSCQTIPQLNLHTFNITTPCPSIEFCIPVNFEVSATATENFCANNDCRFPNQVGYYIQHSGLRCLPLRGSASTISLHWKLQSFLYITILLKFIYRPLKTQL